MMSCKDVAKRAMEKMPMGLGEYLSFKLHLFICKTCRVFIPQMENLNSSMERSIKERVDSEAARKASSDLKEEIKSKFSR